MSALLWPEATSSERSTRLDPTRQPTSNRVANNISSFIGPFRSSSFFETYSWHEKKGNKSHIPLSVFPWSPNVLLSTSAVGTASDRPQTAQQLTRRGEEPCRIVGLEIDAVLLYSVLKKN